MRRSEHESTLGSDKDMFECHFDKHVEREIIEEAHRKIQKAYVH